MSIISWGRRDRVTFSSCGSISDWKPPAAPALFAVTYQRDSLNKPKGHTVFYFGESEDMSRQANSIRAEMSEIWAKEGGRPEDLFVFVHLMDGSTAKERAGILERLVIEYQPDANKLKNE